jgi:acetoin utilization protein AcuB
VKNVGDLMQKQVFSVKLDDPIDRVFFLFHYEKIRHLPVLERGSVVGIVSDRDLYKALGPRSRRRSFEGSKDESPLYVIPKKVKHIMRRGVITVAPTTSLSESAALMARRKIGALPVIKSGKLVGIITATDLLRTFASLAATVEKLTPKKK